MLRASLARKPNRRDERSAWIDPSLLARVDGRLWHATDEVGLTGILGERMIRADARPHCTHGFCRSIGAVSVFDLAEPDGAIHVTAAHWSQWMRNDVGKPRYWIEIDRAALAGKLLDVRETGRRFNERLDAGGMIATRLIFGIEAAHIGPIPIEHLTDVIVVDNGRIVPTRKGFVLQN
jgi:hypothetical protein